VHSSFDIDTDTVSGTLNLTLQNIIMNGLVIKGFDIPPLRFTSITADTRIVNREVTLTRTVLSGMDLRGELRGRITLSKPLRNSRLNLSFEIDKNSRILNDYRILIGNLVGDEENLRINITGMLSKPAVNIPERIPVEEEEEKEKPAVTKEIVPAQKRE
jgi:type II secretion system protein N